MWAVVGLAVVTSVVVHGVAATPVMRWLDRVHARSGGAGAGGRPVKSA
jgi:NhaP-type Na+/H+ or K+/H+ antiporter